MYQGLQYELLNNSFDTGAVRTWFSLCDLEVDPVASENVYAPIIPQTRLAVHGVHLAAPCSGALTHQSIDTSQIIIISILYSGTGMGMVE